MIGSWEIRKFDQPTQFFTFARAYLESSAILCSRLGRLKRGLRYPRASVAMFLAQHSVELFLKGAILAKEKKQKLNQHDLEYLYSRFRTLYDEPQFSWSLPFGTLYPGLTEAEIAEARKRAPQRDQVYRYPADSGMKDWAGIFAFEPRSFREMLRRLDRDMRRIEKAISAVANRHGTSFDS